MRTFNTPTHIILALSILLTLAMAIVAVVWVLSNPSTLRITHVIVEGNLQYLNKQRLQTLILPRVTDGFFQINTRAIKSMLESLDWVQTAQVRRVWPDTIRVIIIEKTVLGHWCDKRLVDNRGRLFKPATYFDANSTLPRLCGPVAAASQMAKTYYMLSKQFKPLNLTVRRIDLSQRLAWDVELSNGTLLRLGREALPTRIARFIHIYPRIIKQKKPPKYADLRYTNGISVSW